MDFNIKTSDKTLASMQTDCLVVGVYEKKVLSQSAQELDSEKEISQALKSGDISGKAGSSLLLRNPTGCSAQRVLLIGLGATPSVSAKDWQIAIKAVVQNLSMLGAQQALLALMDENVSEKDIAWKIQSIIYACEEHAYRSDTLKSKKDPHPAGVQKLDVRVPSSEKDTAERALKQAQAIVAGIRLTKDLANLPGNICTPTYLAEQARKLAKDWGFGLEVLDKKQIQSLKMNSFLSVAKGSDEPPKFIVLKYTGTKSKIAPVVLVGKGITFDSGGISLKPGSNMDEMKYDMCGAASVLGTFRALGELQPKQNVIGIIPACENLPSGHANKPGDIVTSMSGQTIEILNTDAEGRLILCDALTYAERFKPEAVIDIATLTGACVTALGHHNTGLFTRHDDRHDELADSLITAGKTSGDTVWRMPVEDVYQEQLKSNFADMANIGGPPAGSITAACFLERYTRKYTWAHLDIAGTAWKGGAAKGATGRPVPLLCTWLLQRETKK